MTEQILNKINRYMKQDIREQIGIKEIKTIKFLAQGEYNRNFLIEDVSDNKFVFRMNYGSQINVEKQARYEFNALKILYRSRHTPEPLYLDDSKEFFDHDILIEKFLPGRPLIYHEDLNKAAEIFASIHNLKLSKDEISYLKVEKNICSDRLKEATQLFTSITDSDKLNSDQKNILFSLKSWCEKNVNDEYFAKQDQCLVNTEVNSNNFLITPDYGWLIDWEKPVYSNAVQDLTQFMAKTTTLWRTTEVLSEQQIDQFLNKYAELTEQSVDQLTTNINLYMPFLLLRALSWCGMLIATYDQKPIQNEEILHRCEDFLQLDFAIPLLSKYGVIL